MSILNHTLLAFRGRICAPVHISPFTVQVKPCMPPCANKQWMFENCLLVEHDICPRAQPTSMGRLLSVLLFVSITLMSSDSLRLDHVSAICGACVNPTCRPINPRARSLDLARRIIGDARDQCGLTLHKGQFHVPHVLEE